jgi:hypothetical protein
MHGRLARPRRQKNIVTVMCDAALAQHHRDVRHVCGSSMVICAYVFASKVARYVFFQIPVWRHNDMDNWTWNCLSIPRRSQT